MFGRTELLDRFAGSLTEVRKTGKGRILAVRGRRQVGKSTAVTAFVEQVDTPHAYFTGLKLAPMHRQLEALAEAFLGSRHRWPTCTCVRPSRNESISTEARHCISPL